MLRTAVSPSYSETIDVESVRYDVKGNYVEVMQCLIITRNGEEISRTKYTYTIPAPTMRDADFNLSEHDQIVQDVVNAIWSS